MSLEDNKMLVDYSTEIAEKIPAAEKMAEEVSQRVKENPSFSNLML